LVSFLLPKIKKKPSLDAILVFGRNRGFFGSKICISTIQKKKVIGVANICTCKSSDWEYGKVGMVIIALDL
jgi:hypothetical protein